MDSDYLTEILRNLEFPFLRHIISFIKASFPKMQFGLTNMELEKFDFSSREQCYIEKNLIDFWQKNNIPWKKHAYILFRIHKRNLTEFFLYRTSLPENSLEKALINNTIRIKCDISYSYRLYNNLFLNNDYQSAHEQLIYPTDLFKKLLELI